MFILKRIIIIFSFMTRIPFSANFDLSPVDMGKSLAFAPLVGIIIGLLMYLSVFMLEPYSSLFYSVICIAIYIIITGGLHLDGLGDTFDGIFSNGAKAKILEIMRDSRLGTFGLLAIALCIMLNITSIAALPRDIALKIVLLMPVMGRLGSVCSASFATKYARDDEMGLGKSFIENCGITEMALGLLISLIISYALLGKTGLVITILTMDFAYIFTKHIERKIDGMTGDTCGACCELCQSFMLFVSVLYFGRIV